MTNSLPPYSVLISVYAKETPSNMSLALESVLTQTVAPNEIILVKDGPLTEALEQVLSEKTAAYPGVIKPVPLEKNGGLGNALRIGLEKCSFELVARMDTDDICFPDRMEKQLTFFSQHPDIDILSGAIEEFDLDTDHITSRRVLPLDHDSIARFALTRSPFNHMAVMFKKSKVLEAGSYRGDLVRVEDHDLWMRMLRCGARCANLPDSLVYARCGEGMHTRRHGKENAKALYKFYHKMYELGEIGRLHFIFDVTCACGLQFMPPWLHKICYKIIRGAKKPIGMGISKRTSPALPRGNALLYTPDEAEENAAKQGILEIYKDVKALCDALGLTIMLSGGSCLGAVRHKGFIPWDDDMDCVMPRADYETLKTAFDEHLGDKYELQVPNLPGHISNNTFMKIIAKNGLKRREIDRVSRPGCDGLWLDIVPIDYAPDNIYKRILKGVASDALRFIAVSRLLYAYRNPVYKAYMTAGIKSGAIYHLRNFIGLVFSFKSGEYWVNTFDKFCRGKTVTQTVTHAAGVKNYLGEARDIGVMLPPAEGEFEGESVSLPAKAHSYLHRQYGPDYMLPPAKKSAHRYVKHEYEIRNV